MRYLSGCSGIEAATIAWYGMGWNPVAFSEIEAFPSAVLAHHFPNVPNLGDFTKINHGDYRGAVDLVVAGTPCQAFSVAGLRQGLADPRGNLTLEFLRLLAGVCPRWVVWENVPGVLSIDGGRVFGAFLGGLAQLGYGTAYRILDAQYFGVAQRRRRVFVVGYLGDWRRAAAVLFEPESLRGNPAPSREARKDVAPALRAGASNGGAGHGARSGDSKDELIVPVAPCLRGQTNCSHRSDTKAFVPVVAGTIEASIGRSRGAGISPECLAFGGNNTSGPIDVGTSLNAHAGPHGRLDFESETFVVGAMPAAGGTSKKHGQGWGQQEWESGYIQPVAFPGNLSGTQCASTEDLSPSMGSKNPVAVAFDTTQITSKENRSNPKPGDACHPLASGAHAPAVAFQSSQSGTRLVDHHATLDSNNGSRRHNGVVQSMQVRRLTPRECERLQGFPDDYTRIPVRHFKSKPTTRHFLRYRDLYEENGDGTWTRNASDGPRYKALGNSMCVNVMRWIGKRIERVNNLDNQEIQ